MEYFAFIAIEKVQRKRAVKLFSKADHLRETIKSVRTPIEQEKFDGAKTDLRHKIDDDKFKNAWEGGCLMTMEQAIEFALVKDK